MDKNPKLNKKDFLNKKYLENWFVDLFLKSVLTVNFLFKEEVLKMSPIIRNSINYFESFNFIIPHSFL